MFPNSNEFIIENFQPTEILNFYWPSTRVTLKIVDNIFHNFSETSFGQCIMHILTTTAIIVGKY